jgi:hypothetical protein
MPSGISKTIKGNTYYYLAASARVNGKPRIVEQTYLGTAADIAATGPPARSWPATDPNPRPSSASVNYKDPHVVSFSSNRHHTDAQIRVHVFCCVLALTIAHLMRRQAAHLLVRQYTTPRSTQPLASENTS